MRYHHLNAQRRVRHEYWLMRSPSSIRGSSMAVHGVEDLIHDLGPSRYYRPQLAPLNDLGSPRAGPHRAPSPAAVVAFRNSRRRLCDSNGVPTEVVNTKPCSSHSLLELDCIVPVIPGARHRPGVLDGCSQCCPPGRARRPLLTANAGRPSAGSPWVEYDLTAARQGACPCMAERRKADTVPSWRRSLVDSLLSVGTSRLR